jgi:glycosyltransferase involved in cell wall biosynthesis
MDFTFGIITNSLVTNEVIDSILKQDIINYEIVVVGGRDEYIDEIKYVPFDETTGNYTVKKNLITQNAKYDNIVFMHDYFYLEDSWYMGFQKFGDDWDICMNIIKNLDGSRFRDWCVYDDPELNFPGGVQEVQTRPVITDPNHRLRLPSYEYNKFEYMYISGGYWVAKKYVMEDEPLNENLNWGESEDVEWSKRVLPKYVYKMNQYSSIKSLKDKRLSAEYVA